MSVKKIDKCVIIKLREWLGDEGLSFFKSLKEKYGELNVVYSEGGLPHPVHLREGMQIRNFLRQQNECKSWDDIDFDDNWVTIIEEVIK